MLVIFLHKYHYLHIYIVYIFIKMSSFLVDSLGKTIKLSWQ